MSKLRKSPEVRSDFCLSAYFCLIFACESKACAGEVRDTEGRGLNQERYRGKGTESGAWQRGGAASRAGAAEARAAPAPAPEAAPDGMQRATQREGDVPLPATGLPRYAVCDGSAASL